jgi:NADP-dependent 3-hydroxy acid dehydrogenase YdfG
MRRRGSLAERRVLVTGGSSGIGLECARLLLDRGARVFLVARSEQELAQARERLGPVLTHVADVGDAAATAAAVSAAAARFGGLDAVIANAGAAVVGPFADARPDDIERTVRTTLLGVLNTARAALPHLERQRGTLVILGSIAGRVPTPWLAAYAAAKHGVRGFARSLHAELRAQRLPVRVALVAPGPVDTPFWERSRTTDGREAPRLAGVYRPEDVARTVVRALERPRPERAVGGLRAAWAFADALAPRLSLAATGALAGLSWRRREARPASPGDGLHEPAGTSRPTGGLPSRPSLRVRLPGGPRA